MNRVGHAFIKQRMREEDAIFGGEVTGHYYFRDNFYADNGFIPALLILELMSKKGQSLRELLAPLSARVFHLRRDQHQGREHGRGRREARRHRVALRGRPHLHARWRLDRLSATGTSTCAPSNTEPLLRLNLEAATPEQMAAKRDEVLGFIRNSTSLKSSGSGADIINQRRPCAGLA